MRLITAKCRLIESIRKYESVRGRQTPCRLLDAIYMAYNIASALEPRSKIDEVHGYKLVEALRQSPDPGVLPIPLKKIVSSVHP